MRFTKHQHEKPKDRPSSQPCGCNPCSQSQRHPEKTHPRAHSSVDQTPGNDEAEKVARETPTTVEYGGHTYKLMRGGKYYRRTVGLQQTGAETLLHRQIYVDMYGNIPKKHDAHHVNGNPHDNTAENLVAIDKKEHAKLHQKSRLIDPEKRKVVFKALEMATQANPFHASPTHELVCKHCGGQFMAPMDTTRFCSPECRDKARHAVNGDAARLRMKEYWRNNKAKISERMKKYRAENKAKLNQKRREKHHRNRKDKQSG